MQLSTVFFTAALLGYVLDLGLFLLSIGLSRPPLRTQRWVLYAAFILHTMSLLASSLHAGQCPLFTMQGSLSLMAWLTILICVLLGLRFRLNALEGLAPILVIILMVASAFAVHRVALPLNLPEKAWISFHAALYFAAYSAFAVMFLASCLYLLLENQLKRRHLTVFTGDLGSLALMDKINYVALGIGVLCLTVGIATGIGILKEVHGTWFSSMGSDPKMAAALFTWVLYMALLFARSTNRLRGRKVAFVSMAGFAVVFVTFLGIHHLDKVL